MKYINALKLLELSVKNNILKEENKHIAVYRNGNKPGWYWVSRDFLAQELMNDADGQIKLISALKSKDVDFMKDYNKL